MIQTDFEEQRKRAIVEAEEMILRVRKERSAGGSCEHCRFFIPKQKYWEDNADPNYDLCGHTFVTIHALEFSTERNQSFVRSTIVQRSAEQYEVFEGGGQNKKVVTSFCKPAGLFFEEKPQSTKRDVYLDALIRMLAMFLAVMIAEGLAYLTH